jgi:hypothetical protein
MENLIDDNGLINVLYEICDACILKFGDGDNFDDKFSWMDVYEAIADARIKIELRARGEC